MDGDPPEALDRPVVVAPSLVAGLAAGVDGTTAGLAAGLAAARAGLAMAPGALENGQQLPVADSTALARSLLPTVHHPAIEYNIPAIEVERYSMHYNFFLVVVI